VLVLLSWSHPCIGHDQHNGHPFFIVVSNTSCPAVFVAASCQVTFNILVNDVNKDWTHKDKDKDKDLTYNDLQGLTRTYR